MGMFGHKTRLSRDPRPGDVLQPASKGVPQPRHAESSKPGGTIPALRALGPGSNPEHHAAGAPGHDSFYTVSLDSPEKRSPSFTEAELVTPRGSLMAWLPSALNRGRPSEAPPAGPARASDHELPPTPRIPITPGDALRWQPEAGGTPRSVQRLTRLLSQAPESPSRAAATTQTEGNEHVVETTEAATASAPPASKQPANGSLARDDALREENEQLLLLARKQDGMLAGLQADLEARGNELVQLHQEAAAIAPRLASAVQAVQEWQARHAECAQQLQAATAGQTDSQTQLEEHKAEVQQLGHLLEVKQKEIDRVRGILSGAQEELRRLDERQTANSDAASSLADLTQQHDDLKKELQDATTLAETKLNVSQAHAAAAIAQNEQLAQAATEAVQQLDEASQTIQNLGTRAEQQAEEHQLRISELEQELKQRAETSVPEGDLLAEQSSRQAAEQALAETQELLASNEDAFSQALLDAAQTFEAEMASLKSQVTHHQDEACKAQTDAARLYTDMAALKMQAAEQLRAIEGHQHHSAAQTAMQQQLRDSSAQLQAAQQQWQQERSGLQAELASARLQLCQQGSHADSHLQQRLQASQVQQQSAEQQWQQERLALQSDLAAARLQLSRQGGHAEAHLAQQLMAKQQQHQQAVQAWQREKEGMQAQLASLQQAVADSRASEAEAVQRQAQDQQHREELLQWQHDKQCLQDDLTASERFRRQDRLMLEKVQEELGALQKSHAQLQRHEATLRHEAQALQSQRQMELARKHGVERYSFKDDDQKENLQWQADEQMSSKHQDMLQVHTASLPKEQDADRMERLLLKLSRTQRQRDSQVARCKTLEACLTTYQAALVKSSQSPKKAPANSRRRHELERY